MEGSTLDSETEAFILRQVEFYFSDSNLPGDKFLLRTIEESPDELVNLSLICSFSRMRKFLGLKEHGPEAVATEKVKLVADILRKSTTLKLSDDGERVGRVEKLKSPAEVQADVDRRSLAFSPLPWNITLDEVERFFREHCKICSVRLPRLSGAKCFSGYVVVEFSSLEECERALSLKLTFQGAELEGISKKAFEDVQKSRSAKIIQPSNGHGRHQYGRANDDDYPRGTVVSLVLTRKGTEDPASNASAEEVKDGPVEENGTDEVAVDTESQVSREDIKEALKKFGHIQFIDFARGDMAGFVRFDLEEEAQQARAAAVMAEDGFVIKNHILTLNPVEGEEEKDYWKKLREGQGKRRVPSGRGGGRGGGNNSKGGNNSRGGGKFGGRFANQHKRFRDDDDDKEADACKVPKKA